MGGRGGGVNEKEMITDVLKPNMITFLNRCYCRRSRCSGRGGLLYRGRRI